MKLNTTSLSLFSLSLIILYCKSDTSMFLALGLIGGTLAVILDFKDLFSETVDKN